MAEKKENEQFWLEIFQQEISIKDLVILTGNITDDCYSKTTQNYRPLREFIAEKMIDYNFRCVIYWDKCKGISFPNTQQEELFYSLVKSEKSRSTQVAVKSEENYDTGQPDPALKSGIDMREKYTDIEKLLEIYALIRKNHSIGLIFDWSEFWVTDPQRLQQGEQDFYRTFCLTINSFVFQQKKVSDWQRPNSCMVFISRQLATIPMVLYQQNSKTKMITIPLPDRIERRQFFEKYLDSINFLRKSALISKPEPSSSDFLDLFTDQTDGLRIVDLEQIVHLSNLSKIANKDKKTKDSHPIELFSPEKLVNLYKFGKKKSPWEDLSEDRLKDVENILKMRVVGQDDAVHRVATTIIRAYMGLSGLQHSESRNKPKGVLFFAGPTGVGKTELAKATAEFLFRDENACVRFDMSEFMHEHSDQRLIGAPPGYVGFEDGGQLTNAIMKRPFCVLLFDEIEKAHQRILDIFLQVLEDGRLTDGRGQTVSFSESVIIFTSNIGAKKVANIIDPVERKKSYLDAIRAHFFETIQRPELLNRIGDNIVIFNSIDNQDLQLQIISKKIDAVKKDIKARYRVNLMIDKKVLTFIRSKSESSYGGRGLINTIERIILDGLAWFMFNNKNLLRDGRTLSVELKTEKDEKGIDVEKVNFELYD